MVTCILSEPEPCKCLKKMWIKYSTILEPLPAILLSEQRHLEGEKEQSKSTFLSQLNDAGKQNKEEETEILGSLLLKHAIYCDKLLSITKKQWCGIKQILVIQHLKSLARWC